MANNLVYRHSPLSSQFYNDLNQIFSPWLDSSDDQSKVETGQWAPLVDIQETSEAFILLADIPGIDLKSIEISMDKEMLTIKGEREVSEENESLKLLRSERPSGIFYRRFGLPDTANPDAITAEGKNGVLQITIPKQEKSKPRRIDIKVTDE